MRNLCIRLHTKTIPNAKEQIRRAFSSETGGAGIIAAVILVVLVVALAIIFKDNIQQLWKDIWGSTNENAKGFGTMDAIAKASGD